jgi:hypothetical protein
VVFLEIGTARSVASCAQNAARINERKANALIGSFDLRLPFGDRLCPLTSHVADVTVTALWGVLLMYLFLKAEPSPDVPYQLLFITVTASGGGWVTLYSGEKGQALVLEQNEFPTLEAAIGRGDTIREELQKNGWRPYHPAVAGLNRSSYGAAIAALQG